MCIPTEVQLFATHTHTHTPVIHKNFSLKIKCIFVLFICLFHFKSIWHRYKLKELVMNHNLWCTWEKSVQKMCGIDLIVSSLSWAAEMYYSWIKKNSQILKVLDSQNVEMDIFCFLSYLKETNSTAERNFGWNIWQILQSIRACGSWTRLLR